MFDLEREIPGYEGLYKINTSGNVTNIKRNTPVVASISGNYLKVTLGKKAQKTTIRVHQLVAMAFLEYVRNGKHDIVVDHIDNNPLNNHLLNLQLISSRANCSKDKAGHSSIFTGVAFRKDSKKNPWRALIKIDGKSVSLGSYPNQCLAHLAYQNRLANV